MRKQRGQRAGAGRPVLGGVAGRRGRRKPAQLVQLQDSSGNRTGDAADVRDIHGLFDIHAGPGGDPAGVRGGSRDRDAEPIAVRAWVWYRAVDLLAAVGVRDLRASAAVHRDAVPVRHAADRVRDSAQHCRAGDPAVSHRVPLLALAGDRRGERRRHCQAGGGADLHRAVVHRGCRRTLRGAAHRGVNGGGQGLEVDILAAAVGQRGDAGAASFLFPRDQRGQHPVPPLPAVEKADRRQQVLHSEGTSGGETDRQGHRGHHAVPAIRDHYERAHRAGARRVHRAVLRHVLPVL